jgi:hypothetical protein
VVAQITTEGVGSGTHAYGPESEGCVHTKDAQDRSCVPCASACPISYRSRVWQPAAPLSVPKRIHRDRVRCEIACLARRCWRARARACTRAARGWVGLWLRARLFTLFMNTSVCDWSAHIGTPPSHLPDRSPHRTYHRLSSYFWPCACDCPCSTAILSASARMISLPT